ncbi:MAG: hypothetical protein LBU14_02880 [Candidatus Peribacteria bacterium]|nr:hypothetical protein [Candidatus Peribacteria bacterium]
MQINIDSMNIIKYSKSESVIKANIEIFDYDHLKIERFIDRIKLKLKNLLIDIEALNET